LIQTSYFLVPNDSVIRNSGTNCNLAVGAKNYDHALVSESKSMWACRCSQREQFDYQTRVRLHGRLLAGRRRFSWTMAQPSRFHYAPCSSEATKVGCCILLGHGAHRRGHRSQVTGHRVDDTVDLRFTAWKPDVNQWALIGWRQRLEIYGLTFVALVHIRLVKQREPQNSKTLFVEFSVCQTLDRPLVLKQGWQRGSTLRRDTAVENYRQSFCTQSSLKSLLILQVRPIVTYSTHSFSMNIYIVYWRNTRTHQCLMCNEVGVSYWISVCHYNII